MPKEIASLASHSVDAIEKVKNGEARLTNLAALLGKSEHAVAVGIEIAKSRVRLKNLLSQQALLIAGEANAAS